VSIVVIDMHVITHTCPADPEPHAVDIRRRIVHTIPGRPCLTPVTRHSGKAPTTFPCGQWLPSDRQCGNCRTIITVRSVTTEHRGYEGPATLEPTLLHQDIA
jgi:hypothetical protein